MRYLLPALLLLLCTCAPRPDVPPADATETIGSARVQLKQPERRPPAPEVVAPRPLPDTFNVLSEAAAVQLSPDWWRDFRIQPSTQNDYLDSHLTLYSKAEKLEMRFHLRPERPNDPLAGLPFIRVQTMATNLGSNEEDAVTAVHSLGEEELAALNADWGRLYTFRPKRSYSDRAHAQLLAVYREGRGLVTTVLLFNKPPGTLDDRQLMLRFR